MDLLSFGYKGLFDFAQIRRSACEFPAKRDFMRSMAQKRSTAWGEFLAITFADLGEFGAKFLDCFCFGMQNA